MKLPVTTTTTLLAALIGFAGPASAALSIYESFNYANTDGVNNGAFLGDGNQPGGLGLGTWSQVNSGSNEIDVANGGLTFTDGSGNDLVVAGNAMERAARVGQAAVNSTIDPGSTVALTADGSAMWMTFLYQDRGFSGPDFAIALTSQTMLNGDAQSLSAPGFGVGFGINSVGGPERAIGAAVYNNAAGQTFTPEPGPAPYSFNGPGSSDIHFLAMKVNWNTFGTPDEIFVFDVTDLSTEPAEGTALASDTFDWTQAEQLSLTNLAINESQVNFLDEVRVGTTWEDVSPIVPEPGSLALLGLGGLLLARRRR